MSVSVGVTGTVNGRSASSPTGHSAVNTSSFPTKGNTEKTEANSSQSQKSRQDLGQLQRKITQKTKEKVILFFNNTLHYTHFTVMLFLAPFPQFPLIQKCSLLYRNPTKDH